MQKNYQFKIRWAIFLPTGFESVCTVAAFYFNRGSLFIIVSLYLENHRFQGVWKCFYSRLELLPQCSAQWSKTIIILTLMPLFPLFFCLLLPLVWPGIFNVSLLLIILVGCFYLDIMISMQAWAYSLNWIN